jgi:hypothetical protein
MAQNLTTIEPLKLPDLARPDRMPSLPEWVASRLELLNEAHQNDGTGNRRRMMTLPASAMLGSSERQQLEVYADTLTQTLERTPENSADAEAETLVLVTKLMLALPGQKAGEAGAEATGEAYQAALDDMPPWAVAAAIRQWYRGNSIVLDHPRAQPHDYRWRPAPAVLRKLSYYEMMRVMGRIRKLKQLLSAVPLIEFSADHTHDMRAKLRKLPVIGALIQPEEQNA